MTDIVVLLDASGSMASMGAEPVQAMNAFIKSQQATPIPGSLFSLYTFSSEISKPYVSVPLESVTEYKNYVPDGMTKLFDCIKAVVTDKENTKNVVLVIITDGDDTASVTKSTDAKALLAKCETELNWQLVFLGANKDAFKASGDLGIANACAYDQHQRGGLYNALQTASAPIAAYRNASATAVGRPQRLNFS